MVNTNIPGRLPISLPAFYEEFAWYYPNCEIETKRWFVENAEKDWIYIDCGANIGYYSILFSQLSPNGYIYAVEPTDTFDMLSTNLKYNKCKNVKSLKIALGAEDGIKSDNIYRIWGAEPETKEYQFISLDTLVNDLKITKLDCIKIDVDSFDYEVLLGAEKILDKFNPWIVCELNHALSLRNQSNMQAIEWLMKRGYTDALVLDSDNFVLKRTKVCTYQAETFQLRFSPVDEYASAFPTISVENLPELFTDLNTTVKPPPPSRKSLGDWRMEDDDGPIFKYIYQIHQPKRHLEFGTWQGWGATLCLESSDAVVWTINLPNGELKVDGEWAYGQSVDPKDSLPGLSQINKVISIDDRGAEIVHHQTDAGGYIGHLYRQKNLGNRVCQIYSDSKMWDISPYPPDFFDSILIDGGHQADVVVSDTRKALSVLRSGGVVMWHDFCPLREIRTRFGSVIGVVEAINYLRPELEQELQSLVWIKPSWILLGIKK